MQDTSGIFRILICVVTAFSVGACGSGESYSRSEASYSSSTWEQDSYSTPENPIAESNDVACKDPSHCNPSVAFVKMGVGSCTGFLLASDLLLTNSHCIPERLRRDLPTSCSFDIQVSFPRSGNFRGIDLRCGRVLVASDILPEGLSFLRGARPDELDYALIELEHPVARPSLAISRSGVRDGQILHIAKMNPDPTDSNRAELEEVNCIARQNSSGAPGFTTHFAPVFAFDECQLLPGNSGSPVLQADGKVLGIAQAGFDLESLRHPRLSRRMPRIEDPAPMNFGSNLACIALPFEPSRHLPNECSRTETMRRIDAVADRAGADRDAQLAQIFERANSELPTNFFEWELSAVHQNDPAESLLTAFVEADHSNHPSTGFSANGSEKYYVFRPRCIKDSAPSHGTLVRMRIVSTQIQFEPHYRMHFGAYATQELLPTEIQFDAQGNATLNATFGFHSNVRLWRGPLLRCR